MHPILLDWQGVVIPAWHFFYMLAGLAALWALLYLRSRVYPEVTVRQLSRLYLIAYVGAYLGARAFALVVEESQPLADPFGLLMKLFSLGPMTFYGGFMGACLAAFIYLARSRLDTLKLADLACLSGFFALSIGRIGCFLNGDDYGVPVAWQAGQPIPWWAVVFPNHPEPIPRLPVQLWESAAVLILIGFCLWRLRTAPRSCRPGSTALLILLAYSLIRFVLEFYRDDPRGGFVLGLFSPAQSISLALAALLLGALGLKAAKKSLRN